MGKMKRRPRVQPDTSDDPRIPIATAPSTAPTIEQRARNIYRRPRGQAGAAPWIGIAPDMIGLLATARVITSTQHDAARLWQEVRAAYVAELGVPTGRSCLDIVQPGHDASDGNIEAVIAWNTMSKRIGAIATRVLGIECAKGPQERPRDLRLLKACLDRVNSA